jgi:hypothetical protein
MATQIVNPTLSALNAIPLLDASNLPSADDWAILEALQYGVSGDMDLDDRFGRFRLAASFDE